MNKNPKVQLLCLELLEYLTCVSGLPFYQELHTKEFLHVINVYLNNASTDEVGTKVRELVQFWAIYFDKDQDLLPNFGEMYAKAGEQGFTFQPPIKSQYSHFKKFDSVTSFMPTPPEAFNSAPTNFNQQQPANISFSNNTQINVTNTPFGNAGFVPKKHPIFNDTPSNPATNYVHINQVRINNPSDQKIQKVASDLSVLNDNCENAEGLINDPKTEINSQMVTELISNITRMDLKINDLMTK